MRASSARHILPNVAHIVIIATVMDFSGLVLAEAVLSYVGVGVDPTTTSFGTMINAARLEMGREPVVWWSLAAAFVFMFALVLAANLFADAVRDGFDPAGAHGVRSGMKTWSVPDFGFMGTALKIEGLRTVLDTASGAVRAVDGIELELRPGECFALVGESGCGKSMTALSIMRLLPEAGRIAGGRVELDGLDLLGLPEAAMRAVRGKRVAMIFQEPATALNPVLTIGRQIAEVIERHAPGSPNHRERALALLSRLASKMRSGASTQYPFQLSGGLKQRVMIAGALAVDPEVLIADEPTTALDVTIQAQILDLLARLQAERAMALLLITHDLGIVARMAHRVAVMYAGEIVELAERSDFMRAPQHPYSQKLFAALPSPQRRAGELAVIRGQVPPLNRSFDHCRFAERCDLAFDRCRVEAPGLLEPLPGHLARCHLREAGPAGPRTAPEHAGRHGPGRPGGPGSPRGEGPQGALSDPQGRPQAHGRPRESGRWRVLRVAQGAHAGARRRIGLRQDHDRQGDPAAHRAHGRQRAVRRRGAHAALARRAARAALGDADHLPGPVRLAQSAHAGRRDPARGDAQPLGRGERCRARPKDCGSLEGSRACPRRRSDAIRTSSRAGSASASRSRARSR